MSDELKGSILEWRELPDMPDGKWEPSTAVIDDKLYILGGYAEGIKSSKRTDIFDPRDCSWTRISICSTPFTDRSRGAISC